MAMFSKRTATAVAIRIGNMYTHASKLLTAPVLSTDQALGLLVSDEHRALMVQVEEACGANMPYLGSARFDYRIGERTQALMLSPAKYDTAKVVFTFRGLKYILPSGSSFELHGRYERGELQPSEHKLDLLRQLDSWTHAAVKCKRDYGLLQWLWNYLSERYNKDEVRFLFPGVVPLLRWADCSEWKQLQRAPSLRNTPPCPPQLRAALAECNKLIVRHEMLLDAPAPVIDRNAVSLGVELGAWSFVLRVAEGCQINFSGA